MANEIANKWPLSTWILLAIMLITITLVCALAVWYAIGHFIIKFW